MPTIVCIGDSIVEGEGDESGQGGWVGRLHKKILKGSKISDKNRVYNLGMGMETSVDLLHRFFSEVLYRRPDILILQAAHGDFRHMRNIEGIDEFEIGKGARMRTYRRIFEYLKDSKIKSLILSVNPVATSRSPLQDSYYIESADRGLKKSL